MRADKFPQVQSITRMVAEEFHCCLPSFLSPPSNAHTLTLTHLLCRPHQQASLLSHNLSFPFLFRTFLNLFLLSPNRPWLFHICSLSHLKSHCFQARSISHSSNVVTVHFLSLEFHHFGSLRKVIDTVHTTFPLFSSLPTPGCSRPLSFLPLPPQPPYLSPIQQAAPHACTSFGTLVLSLSFFFFFLSRAHLPTLTSCIFLPPSRQRLSFITLHGTILW